MRWIAVVVGLVVALLGIVWFLQGVGILPGSIMTGQLFWAGAGLVAIVIGGLLLFIGLRPRRKK